MVPALIVATMILLGPFSHTQDVLGDGRGDGPTPVIEFDDPEYVRAASQYDLPLNLSEIRDLDEYEELFSLDESQLEFLSEHGLLRVNSSGNNHIGSLYQNLREVGRPIFVTTDSMLHVYHVFFDYILRSVEEARFFNMTRNMTRALLDEAIDQYGNVSGEITYVHDYEVETPSGPVTYTITEVINLTEAARKNVAYLSVALRLLDPTAQVPDYVLAEVQQELSLIDAHHGFVPSPIFSKDDVHYILTYYEDYSQYKPRGHYTRSESLERYFRTMMWYGRMTFRAKCGEETVQGILLADSMRGATHNGTSAATMWNSIYQVTSFFIGQSDDLSLTDYALVTDQVFGDLSTNCSDLLDTDRLNIYIDALLELRRPRICSNLVYVNVEDFENATMGLRMMGQRFIPDSYMFQELVYPNVGAFEGNGTPFTLSIVEGELIRGFPRGMEVMAVMGSEIAEDYLIRDGDTDYENYPEQFGKLKTEFATMGQEVSGQNLYWGLLHTLDSLNEDFTKDQYPTFMGNRAYLAEKLNTQLGFWTELRHDTILYGKQSYTSTFGASLPHGYVEPIPTFYSRLSDLTDASIEGFRTLGILDPRWEEDLSGFKDVLDRLFNISIKELSGEEITYDDYNYIKYIGRTLEEVMKDLDEDAGDSRLVADVHTDPNIDPADGVAGKCLEEAVGSFDFIFVVTKDTDGQLVLTVGPIFSYYEFKRDMSYRLTDEEWRSILEEGTNVPLKFDWMDYPPDLGSICDQIPLMDVGLEPEDIEFSLKGRPDDRSVRINVSVHNRWSEALDVNVSVYRDDLVTGTLFMKARSTVPPGGVIRYACLWNITDEQVPLHKIYVTVDLIDGIDVRPQDNMAMRIIDLLRLADVDEDGVPDLDDAFPNDPAASIDADGDGLPDGWNTGMSGENSTSEPRLWLDIFPDDPAASLDTDGDGHPDGWNPGMSGKDSTSDLTLDDFPADPAASIDSDSDGHPDEWNVGRSEANSTSTPRLSLDLFPDDPTEWADTDGDGHGDNADAFPDDVLEWMDSDADGVGDNADAFPDDVLEWMDSDADGVGNNADAFPDDPAATMDGDEDGHPDKWNPGMTEADSTTVPGLTLDQFPEDADEWKDSDGDGHGDNGDEFPDDADEWKDSDGDGYGDNWDYFPEDGSEWMDFDGDSVGDNTDRFPLDIAASVDSDGDGHPDEWNPGMTREDSETGLELDHYPTDSTRWRKEQATDDAGGLSSATLLAATLLVLACVVVLVLSVRRKRPTE